MPRFAVVIPFVFLIACGGEAPPESAVVAATPIATSEGQSAAAGATSWEAVEGWLVNLTVTVETSTSANNPSPGPGNAAWTRAGKYNARFVAAIPSNYGTPGVMGSSGPSWSLIPSLGSAAILATPLTLSAESTLVDDRKSEAQCPIADAEHTVKTIKTTAQSRTSINEQNTEMMGQATIKLSADLKTYEFMAGVTVREGKQVTDTTSTPGGKCGERSVPKTSSATATPTFGLPLVQLKGLPLPARPSALTGKQTITLALRPGDPIPNDVPATVEWNIVPIGDKK